MAERNLRVRLGAFVAFGVVGLTGLVLLFGGAPELFSSRAKYTVTFPEAPGVAVGTPVRKSGVRVGQVTTVSLDEDTNKVRVGLLMDGDFRPRPSDEATITRGLLSGDTALDFLPKTGADGGPAPKVDPYPVGSEIPGIPPISPRTLLSQTSEVIPATRESLIRLSTSFQRFEQTAPKAEKAFDEVAALARAGREVVPEFRQTNIRLQELIGAADPNDPRDAATPTLRVALREVIDLLRAIRPAADEIAAVLKENGPEVNRTVQSVRRASDGVNDLLNPENRKTFASTLKNVEAGTADLTKTIRLAAILFDSFDKTLRELNGRLAQAEGVLANIDKATKPVAENADQIVRDVTTTVKSVSATAADIQKLVADLRGLVEGGGKGDGTLQRVLGDPSLYNNLNDTVVQAARVLARAEKVTKDLEVFADKIARKPETLGLGGLRNPSTGLKDAPTAPLPYSTPLLQYNPAPAGPGPRVSPVADSPVKIAPIPPLPREGASFKPADDLPPRYGGSLAPRVGTVTRGASDPP
jgi:phospholipid/cholesterol/gamma-HCH transport system substrate-binding protein